MVLIFESKTYESITQRIIFSIFKYGYIAQKYKLFYKLLYSIEIVIESLLLFFMLSVSYDDLIDENIKNFGNIYNSKFDDTKFLYSIFDRKMSYFINFFDFITKMSYTVYLTVLILITIFFLIKLSQFAYCMYPKVSVIKATGAKKIMFYFFSFQDQLLITFFDLIIITLAVSTFSCDKGVNVFFEIECYQGPHIGCAILSTLLLILTFILILIQGFFYDPSNLIEPNNFGLSDNIIPSLITRLQKISLVICNLFFLIKSNQQTIKLSIHIGLALISLYFTFDNQCKFSNFYQNIMIFKTALTAVFATVILLYDLFDAKINIFIFLCAIVCSILIGFLILFAFIRSKTYALYTNEDNLESYNNIVYLIELILRYSKDKIAKIVVNGFIQCYNIEYDDKSEIVVDEEKKEEGKDRLSEAANGANVKYLLTVVNLLIIGSVRDVLTQTNSKDDDMKCKSIQEIKLLEFVCDIIYKHSIKSHNFSFHFKMLTVQIYLRKLNNITRAWFILSNFYETFNKFSIRQQFFIFSMYQELHEALQNCDDKSMHKMPKMKKVIKLEKSNNMFIKKITKCTNAVKLFWLTYMNDKQKFRFLIKEVNKNLSKINRKYQKLQHFFSEIQKLFEDNRSIFYIYCCFLKNIMNNEQFSEHIIKLLRDNKSLNTEKTSNDFIDEDYYKMSSLESIGFLIVSCNNLEIGKIKWCNKKISNILRYSKSDLSKLKINRLIPPIIAQRHNDFLKAFIQTNKGYYSNLTRVTFMITANDYIIPVVMYINLYPRIKNGIEMATMITRVIDNTFILYKNPEIKTKTKLCFVLINEDGSIEAVDKNANTFLGIPNLVRNGWKTKITIDKRKCNLFELSPGLKKFIKDNEANNTHKFINECELDTSILVDEFSNDEYGLFLSINNRINHMISKSIPVEKWIGDVGYYESAMEEEEKEMPNVSSSKTKVEYQSAIMPNVFKVHFLPHEVYEFSSSIPGEVPLRLYLIKYYFPLSSFVSPIKDTNEKKNQSNNANISLGNITGSNLVSGNVSNAISQSKDTFAFAKNKFSRNDLILTKVSKKGSMIKSTTKLGLDLKKSNNNISALINANNQQQITQTINNELSNTSSVIKNTLTKFNITVDKLRLRKEIMIQEKITNQSSSFKIIQFLFASIVIGLIIILSLEVYYRMKQINYLNPLHNLLFLFIYRRDITTNLLLNTMWHLEIENSISKCDTYSNYNMSTEKLINISKIDVISYKTFQDDIIDYYSKISELNVYNNNYTALYYEYDSYHILKEDFMLIDSLFDLFISNFDKYFLYQSYTLKSQRRLLELFNPEFYFGSSVFEESEFETRIVNIFKNGINLITLTEEKLISTLNSFLINSSDDDLRCLMILGITAIVFTFLFSISVLILFLKMSNMQDDIFNLFTQIDFQCAIKVSVICDKFLRLLSHLNIATSYSNESLMNFYSIDHSRIFTMVSILLSSNDKKIGSQQKTSSIGLKDMTNYSNSNMNNSNMNNSSDSYMSSNVKGKMSSSQSGAAGGGARRRNSDEDIIIRYKRYADDNRKKKNTFLQNESSHLITEDNEGNKGIVIIKEKAIFVNAIFILFFFIVILCGFFALLLVLDYRLNHYIEIILSYLTFYQHRYYYTVNNVIWSKMLYITSTNETYNEIYLNKFTSFLNYTIQNEELYHSFIIDKSYLKFNPLITDFELKSLCVLYTTTNTFKLSNNITQITEAICNDTNTNTTDVSNKSLSEIVIYVANFLREKYNEYYQMDKTDSNKINFLNDELLEFVALLSQFYIRQSLFTIEEMLNDNFTHEIDKYSTLCIVLFIVFVIITIIVIFIANICTFLVFKTKKNRNTLLIALMPDEFIVKQIEEEEEERERKKEIE